MEADERFRWLEARISSSLRPRGEDLRRMTVDEDNRTAFLSFCNHSVSRCIFVQVAKTDESGSEIIKVSCSPPSRVQEKTMVFLKCRHASKLTRENLPQDVIYSEFSMSPLGHLDLVMKEIYLPLMTSSSSMAGHSQTTNEKLVDLLHRISSGMQITNGFSRGKVVLPLPSDSTMAQTALTSPDRHSVVVHVLETAVVTWMKQVKMSLYCDPTGAILKNGGIHPGPLEEIKFWEARLQRLESVRDQLSSIPILTILHNLEAVHSTYSQGFSHAQYNISQAIQEAEHCLGFLRTWKPWLVRLHDAEHPNTITTSFAPIMAVLLLIWQYSGYYGMQPAFHRLLSLLANEIVMKAMDIIGSDLLINPIKSVCNLRLALRVCAAFRGCYLGYRERADTWLKASSTTNTESKDKGRKTHCVWPLRNSKVFHSLNAVMERCNDLLELVHTIHDFSELHLVGEVSGGRGLTNTEVVIEDIYREFVAAVDMFSSYGQDLLNLSVEGRFESQFYAFRQKVDQLEKRLGHEIGEWLQRCPSLHAQLRVMELFQCTSHRETVRGLLAPHHKAIMSAILSDLETISHTLTTSRPPISLLHTPPTVNKLMWLHSLRERTDGAVSIMRSVATELLEGELGWNLRQLHSELSQRLQSCQESEEMNWVASIPSGLSQRLAHKILARGQDGELVVNFDETLHRVLCEARHLSRPPLSLRMPPAIKVLRRATDHRELRDRRVALELVMQRFKDIQTGMSEEESLLLQGKMEQIHTVLSSGEEEVNWLSPQFPDFLAKCKTAICVDLSSSLSTLHSFSSTLDQLTLAWSRVPGLDIFATEEGNTLEGLQAKHHSVMERLGGLLPSSLSRIHSSLLLVQTQIHASPESPSWEKFLRRVEHQVTEALIGMVIEAVNSLLHRAHLYEQGMSIPPLMAVRLELVGSSVMFSPPLTPHTFLSSIPENVAGWMESYVAATSQLPRVIPGSKESYQDVLNSDLRVRGALGKVSAHLETNSRQAQNLRSKFSQFCFLWEQDVQHTFRAFLAGEAPPHPKRLSRPETVRSRSAARPHSSGRPKSSQISLSQHSLQTPAPPMNQVTGVSDWDFLCPPGMEPGPEEDISKRPSLDEFDGELAIFQGISDRLNRTEDDCNVGWLNVNQRPIKDTLNTLVSKWKAVYAGYLERQMSQVLNSLDLFLHEVEPEVERMGGEGDDRLSLMTLMTIFNRVNAQQVEMDKKFGTLHRAYALLDRFSHPLPQRLRDQFNTAPTRWSNLKKRISLGKQRMGPSIQSHSDTITDNLTHFGQRYSKLYQEFQSSQSLKHGCGLDRASELVKEMEREVQDLQNEACKLIELQELLGTSVFNFSLLNEFQQELFTLSELWTLFDVIMREHTVWQESQWSQVDTPDLEELVAAHLASVQALPCHSHDWDVYQHLISFLQITQLTLPLVEGLRSVAIRPRHWKLVLRLACPAVLETLQLISRGGGLNNSTLEHLTLSQLISLELHKSASEVLQVVERAKKEVAIEALLNTFEEVWLSRQLEFVTPERQPLVISREETVSELGLEGKQVPVVMKPRVSSARISSALKRSRSTTATTVTTKPASPTPPSPLSPPPPPSSTDPRPPLLPLLCNTESIFETLESHQTSLQSVMDTAAATSFTDDLQRWQKQLQTIEAVLEVWLRVQSLWTQLEVYQNVEVQQTLPAQYFTFSTVEKDWRELTQSSTTNPSVMSVCLKEGVLSQLEKLQESLLQCRAALVEYAEGQRAKCHWFHFLPLDDVLQFVCYGSRVDQLSCLIHKLLPHAGGLLYTHSSPTAVLTPSHSSPSTPRPTLTRITGVVSHLGENLELHQSVSCSGTVESIVSSLFSSLHFTLHSQLSSTMMTLLAAAEPSSSSSSSSSSPSSSILLSRLPSLWCSQLSTQIVLLATQIGLDTALDKSYQTTTRENEGDTHEKETLCEEIQKLIAMAVRMLQGQPIASRSSQSRESHETVREFEEEAEYYEERDQKERGITGRGFPVTREQAHQLKNIVFILNSSLHHAVEMTQQWDKNDRDSEFLRQGRLKWVWSGGTSDEGVCQLVALGARLSYGYHYVGNGSRLVFTPSSEKAMVFLLRTMGQGHHSHLTGPEGCGKNNLVSDLAVMTGHPLFSLHCSSHTTTDTLLSFLKGMVLTGSWFLLQAVDTLSQPILHTLSVLLPQIQQARQFGASHIPWLGEPLPLSPPPSSLSPGVCFATTFTSQLPPELRRVFIPCSVPRPEQRIILEALLLAHNFHSHHQLTDTLDTLFSAANELFNSQISMEGGEGEGEAAVVKLSREDGSKRPTMPLGLGGLEAVVAGGQRYMTEFERLGLVGTTGDSGGGGGGGQLAERSMVLSDISEGARASLRHRAGSVDQTKEKTVVLEELSLLLSVKDHLLPQLNNGSSLDTFVLLLSDIFTSCSVPELLAHETGVRETLAAKAVEDHEEAGNSARESRAASAMMVVSEDIRPPSEIVMTQEEQIVQACLVDNLVPSSSFQLSVSQLLSLLHTHTVVGVVGGACSGKSSVIKIASETFRAQETGLNLSTILPGALNEGELLGKEVRGRWEEGLLPQLVRRWREERRGSIGGEGGSSSGQWIVLDGSLASEQLETLISLCDHERMIRLSNGRSLPIESNYRFILELSSLESLTPRAASSLPRLCLSPCNVSWWDPVSRWLLNQPRERATALEPFLRRFLSPCLEFLAPVLARDGGGKEEEKRISSTGVSRASLTSSISSGATASMFKLAPQDVKLHPVHLSITCCTILKVSLSFSSIPPTTTSEDLLLPHLAYSLAWSMGGHLSPDNKHIFDQWWRESFSSTPSLIPPSTGLIWDFCPCPGTPGFAPCSSTQLALTSTSSSITPTSSSSSPPFISSGRANAMAHIITSLVSQGQPVLLVGDLGSGKTALLQQMLLSKIVSNDLILQHFYVSQLTTGQSFWKCLKEHLEWKWGRNYAPRGPSTRRLVCFLDDLHNSASSGSLAELVRGHVSSGGVWEGGAGETQRWYHVANTSYVCTTYCDDEHPLDLRLARHFTVLHWDGYDSSDMEAIFSAILSPYLSSLSVPMAPRLEEVGIGLVKVAVQVHQKLTSLFLPSPNRYHYLFNLRHISGIFRRLSRWCSEEKEVTERGLALVWQRESWWTYSGVLSSKVDRERYWEVACHSLRKHFSQSKLLPELLEPVSYQLTATERETLRETLLQQLVRHSEIHINLYDMVLEEIHQLSQLIQSPFDLSHVVLLGHAHPDPLVQLAAVHCGYTVTRPSAYFSQSLLTSSASPPGMSPSSYSENSLKDNLCSLYSDTGVKNKRVLLLVTSVEMLYDNLVGFLHEAVCDAHITHLFSSEERTRIVNAVRSDVTRAGLVFSPSTAWSFFLSRVRQNLRIVMAMPQLKHRERGCRGLIVHWREVLSRVNIHYHQPWTQRELVAVGLHHLKGASLLSDSMRENCAHMLAAIHLQLRDRRELLPAYNCTFQYLVEWFVAKLQQRHDHLTELSDRLIKAMKCVERARERSRELEEKQAREERVLEEREDAYKKVLVQLGQDTAISEEQSRLVTRQTQRVSELQKMIPEYELGLQMAREEKLSLVLHLKRQVMNLNHSSLTELRAQQRPPQLVEDLLATVISVVKSPSADLSWTKGAKRLMANIDRFQELLLGKSHSEADSVTILKLVKPTVDRLASSVDEYESYPGGLAATQLLEWVRGVVKMHRLLENQVRPLESRMSEMTASLADWQVKLRKQGNKMEVLSRRISGLSEGLESAAVQCSTQRETVGLMKNDLQQTQTFVQMLSMDYEKWKRELDLMECTLSQELGSLDMSACVPVYLASIPPHIQMDILHNVLFPLFKERGVSISRAATGKLPIGAFCEPPDNSPTSSSSSSSTYCFSTSYAGFCQIVLPHLAPVSFRSRWLEEGHGLPAVLNMSLVGHSWCRSLLLYDPEDFTSHWLNSWKGDQLLVVDYRQRDLKFYLSIEHALLCGQPLLVKGVTTPIDPTLQPLLEMLHGWEEDTESHQVQLCGRKILANRGFTVFLSTLLPLSSFPPTLTCITTPLDFSFSLPWATELLFYTACSVSNSTDDNFKTLVKEVVKAEQKLEELEVELPALLSNSHRDGDNYHTLAQRANAVFETRKESEEKFMKLKDQLSRHIATRSHIMSLTIMASGTSNLLHQASPLPTPVMNLLQRLLISVLSQPTGEEGEEEETDGEREVLESLAGALQTTTEVLDSATDGEEEKEVVMQVKREEMESKWRERVLRKLMQEALQEMTCVLDHYQLEALGCALSILSTISPITPPSLVHEQLIFLVNGGDISSYHSTLTDKTEETFRPVSISPDLWAALHNAPFSRSYFARYIAPSCHQSSDTYFWEGIGEGEVWSISEFPWRKDWTGSVTLDDILMLLMIHMPSVLEVIGSATCRLTGSVRPRPLSELVSSEEGDRRKPLLLLDNSDELLCELNSLLLEEEFRKISGDRPVRVDNVAAVMNLLECNPTAITNSNLLVTGLGHCHSKWLPIAAVRMQHLCDNGYWVVAVVAAADTPHLTTLSTFCRVVRLAHLALPHFENIPSDLATSPPGLLPDLLHLLTFLPHFSSRLSSLSASFQPLIFHLSLLHCAVHHLCRLIKRPAPPFSLFSSSLSILHTFTQDGSSLEETVKALHQHTLELYGLAAVVSGPRLKGLVSSCLDLSTVEDPGCQLSLNLSEQCIVEVVTPGPGLPLKNYGDHVMGMMSCDSHVQSDTLSHDTLSSAVFDLLLPMFNQLSITVSPHLTPSPTSHHPSTKNTPTVSSEEKPHPQAPPTLTTPTLLGSSEGSVEGADVCSRLSSSRTYLSFIWNQAMGSMS